MEFLPAGGQEGSRTGENMNRRPRRNHAPAFKAKVALAAGRGELTLANDFLGGALSKAGLLSAKR